MNAVVLVANVLTSVPAIWEALCFVFDKVREVLSAFMNLLKQNIEPKVQKHVEKNLDLLEKAKNPGGATKVTTLDKEIFELEKAKEDVQNKLSDNDINKAKAVKID